MTQWLGESQNRGTYLRKGMPLGEALPAAGLKRHMVLPGAGQQRLGKLPGGCPRAHLSSSRQWLDTQVHQRQVGVPREPGGLESHKFQRQVAGLPSKALGIKPDLALPVDFSTGAMKQRKHGIFQCRSAWTLHPQGHPRAAFRILELPGHQTTGGRRDTGRYLKRELEL